MSQDDLATRITDLVSETSDTNRMTGLYMLCNLQRIALHTLSTDLSKVVAACNTILASGDTLAESLNIPKDVVLAQEEMITNILKGNPSLDEKTVRQLFNNS